MLLAAQVAWSADVEGGLRAGATGATDGGGGATDGGKKGAAGLAATRANVVRMLSVLAREVLQGGVAPERRRKYEQLITALVHQRDVVKALEAAAAASGAGAAGGEGGFAWLAQLRYYWRPARSSKKRYRRMLSREHYEMNGTAACHDTARLWHGISHCR